MGAPLPPRGYESWLEYAIATMDVERLPKPAADESMEAVWGETPTKESYRKLVATVLDNTKTILRAALKDDNKQHKQWYIRQACKTLGIGLHGIKHDRGLPPPGAAEAIGQS